MKKIVLMGLMGVVASAFAAPTVTNVQMAQTGSRHIEVSYTLGGEDAIVTVDFLTNGVSIGEQVFTTLDGDVNCKVARGDRKLRWKARKDWPDRQARLTAKVRAWTLMNPPDYMTIDLVGESKGTVRYYVSTNALPGGLASDVYRKDKMVLRKIPARGVVWTMGTAAGDSNRQSNEKAHQVVLTQDYFFSIYLVTQQQYLNIMGSNPSHFQRAQYGSDDYLMGPVESVSFNTYRGGNWPTGDKLPADGTMIAKLRDWTGLDGLDLPTETQWEYACRAGTMTWRPWGNTIDATLLNYGSNVKNNIEEPSFAYRTTRVDDYPPNAWGLYDVLGNVEEMCLDWYVATPDDFKSVTPVFDPVGPASADGKVTRGGGCLHNGTKNRSAWRRDSGTDVGQGRGVVGVRVCCPVK